MKKNKTSLGLVLVLLSTLAIGIVGCGGTAQSVPSPQQTGDARSIEQASSFQWNQQGQLEVVTRSGMTLTTEDEAKRAEAIRYVNQMVHDQLIRPDDVRLETEEGFPRLSRNNAQGVRWHWWGCYILLNNTNAQKYKSFLSRDDVRGASDALSAAVGAIGGLAGSVTAVVITSNYRNSLFENINKNRGIAIKVNYWWPHYAGVSAQ